MTASNLTEAAQHAGVRALLTVAEAAHWCNVHPMTIRRMIARGDIPAIRVGRQYRIDLYALRAALSGVAGDE